MQPVVEVYNHQAEIILSDGFLERIATAANLAIPHVLAKPANGGGVLAGLEVVEVSIVNDETIAQVHVDFMDVAGATDVITFAHGEVVLSAQTAQSYGQEYGNAFDRELMLYVIHGLLHLSGHEDENTSERATMEEIQFQILDFVWK